MFYYLYEIRNNLNGKVYVGVHKTKDMNDGYMGSGKIIKRAIEKHGLDNFTKVVLEHFDSSEAMYAREKEIVTDEFLLSEDVYNLRRGGLGGFEYINKNELYGFSSIEVAKKGRELTNKILEERYGTNWRSVIGQNAGRAGNAAIQLKRKSNVEFNATILEKLKNMSLAAQSDEAKLKRKQTMKDTNFQQGKNNSQYGKMWICNDALEQCLKINNTDPIPLGWRRGRVLKWYKINVPQPV